jgi:hypothetical protein
MGEWGWHTNHPLTTSAPRCVRLLLVGIGTCPHVLKGLEAVGLVWDLASSRRRRSAPVDTLYDEQSREEAMSWKRRRRRCGVFRPRYRPPTPSSPRPHLIRGSSNQGAQREADRVSTAVKIDHHRLHAERPSKLESRPAGGERT